MPWLIKTKGRLIHVRDGAGGPLYVIDDARWYPFEHLPPGTDPAHDGDLLCREADSIGGYESAPLLSGILAEQAAKEPPSSKPEIVTERIKRKSRVR